MYKYCIIFAFLVGANICLAQRGESFQSSGTPQPFEPIDKRLMDDDTKMLDKSISETIYIALGYSTYLQFPANVKIEHVVIGAGRLVKVEQTEKNALVLMPLVQTGHTNMIIVINKIPYTFEINIRNQGEINYRVTYTVPAVDGNPSARHFGPPVRPDEIDSERLVRLVETYGGSNVSREHQEMEYQPLNKAYTWNNSLIYLADAFGLPSENIVVLRIIRRNVSSSANYLHVDQIKPFVGNTPFPVTVGRQSRAELLPGQMDTIYLMIQGYNNRALNDYYITLPPEAKNIEKLRQ